MRVLGRLQATRRDADHAWMATKWIDVSRTLAEGDAVEIQARASLDRLHALWSLRMTQRVPFQVSALAICCTGLLWRAARGGQ
jgi:hypothetical protein